MVEQTIFVAESASLVTGIVAKVAGLAVGSCGRSSGSCRLRSLAMETIGLVAALPVLAELVNRGSC